MKDLFDVIAKIDSKESITNFFRDICTIKEIKSMAERWKVCKLLEKWASYRTINEKTWVSTTTITRVAHWLHHWTGGYAKALKIK